MIGNRTLNLVICYIMCVDELLVKDSHSYQVGWVGFGPGQQVTVWAPQRMTAGMKGYGCLAEVVVMKASILPSEDYVACSVPDLCFAPYLGEETVNWKVCTSHFEVFSNCAPS